MNLYINRLIEKPALSKDSLTLKERIADTIENKKKYGIPLLPIYTKEKEMVNDTILEEVKEENKKLVSLTFDGDSKECIDSLMDVLNRNKSRATFFILGNSIDNNVDTIRKIAAYGNEIGIQGYTQTPFTKKDIADVKEEISYTCDRLKEIGVIPSLLVRPPLGKLNATIKENIDIPLVLSNINLSNEDVKEDIKSAIVNNITPGSIIKLKSNEVTLEALNEIIPILIKKGYKFVTVSEMNKEYSHKLEPGRVYAYINDKKAA